MPRTRLLTVTVLIALIAACRQTPTVPGLPVIAGIYSLAAVNRAPLPTADTINGELRTFTNGTLTVADSTYRYTVCVDSTGVVDKVCGADRFAITDSGLVWWSPRGASFIGTASHVSRALIVNQDSLIFNANDLATARFTFVR